MQHYIDGKPEKAKEALQAMLDLKKTMTSLFNFINSKLKADYFTGKQSAFKQVLSASIVFAHSFLYNKPKSILKIGSLSS